MCKMCRGWDTEYRKYQDFKQGGVEPDDFYIEVNYTPKKKTKSKPRNGKKRIKGCAGNDYGAHVYVWTTQTNVEDLFFRYFGYHKYERNICVGCGRRNGKRLSARYEKIKARTYRKMYGNEFDVTRGHGPVPRGWRARRGTYKPAYHNFRWEEELASYKEYRQAYIDMYGYTEKVNGNIYDWMF